MLLRLAPLIDKFYGEADMRLFKGFKEIFYFPFYFTSLNVAGFISFMRFIRGTQPPMWKKSDRLPRVIKDHEPVRSACVTPSYYTMPDLGNSEDYGTERLDYPKISSGNIQ